MSDEELGPGFPDVPPFIMALGVFGLAIAIGGLMKWLGLLA